MPPGPGETAPRHSVQAWGGRVQADMGHLERVKVGSLPTEERDKDTQHGIGPGTEEKASQAFM